MKDSSVTAIILAAGVGSRLRPLTNDRPKCLVPVAGRSILQRGIDALMQVPLRELIVVTGYCANAVHEAITNTPWPVRFAHNERFDQTQNVASLACALEVMDPNAPFLKLDGDLLFRPAVLQALLQADGDARIAVQRSSQLGAEEMKVLVEQERVRAFGKGLEPARAWGESIGMEGFFGAAAPKVRSAILAAVKQGRTDLYYEDVYNDVIDQIDARVTEIPAEDWCEIDDAQDLAAAEAWLGSVP